MSRIFTKENMKRLTSDERRELMYLQMSPQGNRSAYLPDDCGECGACGDTMFGSSWCPRCFERYDYLMDKMMPHPVDEIFQDLEMELAAETHAGIY